MRAALIQAVAHIDTLDTDNKQQWTRSIYKRGERRGETRAKRETLLKLLHLHFDPVPESIITKITSIRSLSRLDALFEKVATAQTLDEIEWEDHEDRF